MTSFDTLLAATDFSLDGNDAVRRAALLAHGHGARLHILHVLDGGGCRPLRDWFSPTIDIDLKAAQARAALRRMALEITGAHDVAPTVEVVVGDPFETLLRAAERADLVVIGRRGRRRFDGLRVGTTAERLLRLCRRPVLAVRTPVERPYRQVLVPIDFTASSDAALRVAARVRREASLQVFHAIDSRRDAVLLDADVPAHVVRETRLMEQAGTTARMRRRVAGLGLDGAPMSFALGHGAAATSTLQHAREHGADLIVAGRQGRSAVGTFLLGSVSSRLMSQARCDVLIVPAPRNGARAAPTAPPGRPDPGPWIHNTARFMSRRVR